VDASVPAAGALLMWLVETVLVVAMVAAMVIFEAAALVAWMEASREVGLVAAVVGAKVIAAWWCQKRAPVDAQAVVKVVAWAVVKLGAKLAKLECRVVLSVAA